MKPLFPLLLALSMFPQTAGGGELEWPIPVSRLDLSEWTGIWRTGEDRYLHIYMAEDNALHVVGFAAHPAPDEEEFSEFSARILPGWISVTNRVIVAVGSDGTVPAEEARDGDCVISLKLDWNINWLDARDNESCGDGKVSFTGRYEWSF